MRFFSFSFVLCLTLFAGTSVASEDTPKNDNKTAPAATAQDTQERSMGLMQEGRIMNDENISIKGFIPIVGIKDDKKNDERKNEESGKYDSNNFESYLNSMAQNGQLEQILSAAATGHNFPQHMAQPEDQRGIAAALQGLIGTGLMGNKKPGYGLQRPHAQQMNNRKDCVCVPFYMCKNGFLIENGGQSPSYGQNPAFGPTSGILNQFNPLLSQYQERKGNFNPSKPDEEDAYLPIDERSLDKANDTFTQEILGRMLGGKSATDGCGLLRTCCQKANRGPMISSDFTELAYPGDVVQGRPQHHHMKPNHNYNPQMSHYPSHQSQQSHFHRQPDHSSQQYHNHQQSNAFGYDHPKRQGQFNPTLRPPLPYGRPPKMIDNMPPQGYPQHPIGGYQMGNQLGNHQLGNLLGNEPFMSESVAAMAYDKCGTRSTVGITGRVQNLNYHQSSTEFGEFPWQVAILKKIGPSDNLYVCGGALISNRYILTAAHCLKKLQAGDIKIRLGEWDVHREDEFYPYVEKSIDEITVHPHFSPRNLANDVAILRMEQDIDLSQHPHISPICLADLFDNFSGQRCYVSGWGKSAFGKKGDYQSVLMKVDLPVLENGVCENLLKRTRLGYSYRLDKSMMCAGGEPGKDACEGDGGSGLVCEVNGNWKVAGLVSWGLGCGQAAVPGVYTNIATMKSWIDRTIFPYYHSALMAKNAEKELSSIIHERSFEGTASNSTETPEPETASTTTAKPSA